jgi:hypothetical protein
MRAPTLCPSTANNIVGKEVSRGETGRRAGWDRYLELLMRERVPANARRWHVQRAEDVVAAVRPKRLSALTVAETTAFVPRYAREKHLTDWQCRQKVDTVQLLLVDLAQ